MPARSSAVVDDDGRIPIYQNIVYRILLTASFEKQPCGVLDRTSIRILENKHLEKNLHHKHFYLYFRCKKFETCIVNHTLLYLNIIEISRIVLAYAQRTPRSLSKK